MGISLQRAFQNHERGRKAEKVVLILFKHEKYTFLTKRNLNVGETEKARDERKLSSSVRAEQFN